MSRNGNVSGVPMSHHSNKWRVLSERLRRRWRKEAARTGYPILCGICGREVDLTARPNTRNSLAVDHIVPPSRGGAWLDVQNLRSVHFGCNSAKRDSVVYEHVQVNASRVW